MTTRPIEQIRDCLSRLIRAAFGETVAFASIPARPGHDADLVLSDAVDELEKVRAERDALARFKAYVHDRLDAAGIPTHPDGPHSKEGCRVGDRLDILVEASAEERATIAAFIEREGDPILADLIRAGAHTKPA